MSPGDGRSRCRGGLQSQVSSICMGLLQGTLQVAAPLEVGFQQGLTAGAHPTHTALVWTTTFPAYRQDTVRVKPAPTTLPCRCTAGAHPTHAALPWTAPFCACRQDTVRGKQAPTTRPRRFTAGQHPTYAALVPTAAFPAYRQDTTSVKQVSQQSPVAHAETRLYCL